MTAAPGRTPSSDPRSAPRAGHRLAACVVAFALLAASAPAAARESRAVIRTDAPATMEAGHSYPARVEISNGGPLVLTASASVRVVYRWWTSDGNLVADGPATPLPHDVAPGESVTLCQLVAAPNRAGTLRLQWTLREGGSATAPPRADEATRTVTVQAVDRSPGFQAIARFVLFLLVTIGHFGLVAVWLRRFARVDAWDLDDLAFAWIAVGLGSFLAVLNGLAFTVGLSFAPAVLGFAAVHICAWAAWLSMRRHRGAQPTPAVRFRGHGADTRLAAVGAAVVLAILTQWLLGAPRSMQITGADAAHYHVPYAVNIALGANPFGLPATPHYYPMGTSVLAAWFILPLHDLLLVDLATLLPFLLAWFAIARLVGDLSGRSGLVWGPWCALALFSTPMFRSTLLMSADLFYTAAFLAVNAVLLRVCARMRLEAFDLLLLAATSGLLVGTKVTGTFSLVALLAVYGAILLGRRVIGHTRIETPGATPAIAVAAIAAAFAAGGIWLARNWWCFGSPLAPNGLSLFGVSIFPGATYREDMFYVSVLRDMRDVPHYNVGARLLHWLREWFGTWFLLSAALVALFFADLVRAARRAVGDPDVVRPRLIFAACTTLLIAAHLVLLAGVPWSSLEWTEGFSLRYALPCFTLFALLAYAALFPVSSWRVQAPSWLKSRPEGRNLQVQLLVLVAVAWYVGHQGAPGVPVDESAGRLTVLSVVTVLAFAALGMALARIGRRALRYGALGAIVGLVAAGYAVYTVRQDGAARQAAAARFDLMAVCGDNPDGRINRYNGVYFTLLGWERSTATVCPARRIFTTARWDSPLELQSPVITNQVFDVRGATVRSPMLRHAHPGGRPCDYVVATEAELMTMRGVPLLNLLKTRTNVRRIGGSGPFVVFAAW